MSFITDKQTITDLDIFGKRGKQSVYAIFNHTSTSGGALVLEEMFRFPLGEYNAINERSEMIRLIDSMGIDFPLQPEHVDAAEKYLENTDTRSQLTIENNNLHQKFKSMIGADTEQQLIIKGIDALVMIMHDLRHFLEKISRSNLFATMKGEIVNMQALLQEQRWQKVFDKQPGKKMSFTELVELDKLFRFTSLELLKQLFHDIYAVDVYMAVAKVAVSKKMTYPKALPKDKNAVWLEKVYHPFLQHPVANTIHISKDRNIVFLTGANMAGKSTFMKSVGIALYLAHMGFPVPAEKMEFSVCDGILTTINLSDNLNSGYSHFYSEVLRVKKMAELVKLGKKIFVIFDEMFRGTNVKDAYEATVAITRGLTKKHNCMFMVSTHIMEAGETLRSNQANIHFVFLPTIMNGDMPVYTYQLEEGISDDRHGMLIIQNENILNILKKGLVAQASKTN